ncbi:MAG TPA: cellulase family glycosylhydrolase [Bacteroidota bacterium]
MTRRITSIVFIFVFLLLSTAIAQKARLSYDELKRAPGAAMYHVPIGLCEDYPEESTTLTVIRNDMELLKRSGIGLLRVSFGWDGIELEKDKYHWGFWDDFVKIAVDEYGITLIPYLCYTPAWNSTGDSTNYWNHTPKDYEQFGKFVKVIVNRYKDRIKSWELWNEPDIKEYWSGNAEDLARLVKIGATSVRKADPSALIVCPGLAGHVDFTLSLFRDFGISPYVDVVNLHSYFETWHADPAEQVVPYINRIADIIRKYGNHQSIWMAEVGYSTFRKDDGFVSYQYQAYYDYEHTPSYQANHLFRTLTLILSTNSVAAVAWYEIKDLPPGENVIGDVNNRNLGVAYVDYRAKPAEQSLSLFNCLFAGKQECIDARVTISRAIGSDSEIHCFQDERGDIIVVGWLRTNVAGKRGADKTGAVKDTRTEDVSILIPGQIGNTCIRYDLSGKESPYSHLEMTKGGTVMREVKLNGGELFIAKISR